MIYIITGTSSGIGKALAELYLNRGEHVIGIARTNTIQDPNFTFIRCDFSKKEELSALKLPKEIIDKHYPIRLINNAGVIGNINLIDKQTLDDYMNISLINIVAVQYLCSYVLNHFGYKNTEAIISISSGAGQYPISSWASYCASKAAVNLFMETLHKEVEELGEQIRIYSIAPGVVDTHMQQVIRDSNPAQFSRHEEFVQKKENNELRTPELVAELLEQFLEDNSNNNEVIVRL